LKRNLVTYLKDKHLIRSFLYLHIDRHTLAFMFQTPSGDTSTDCRIREWHIQCCPVRKW